MTTSTKYSKITQSMYAHSFNSSMSRGSVKHAHHTLWSLLCI